MKSRVAVHWFRRDLRLADNTALAAAAREFDAVLPVFILDPRLLEAADIGAPRVAFLLDSLHALRGRLEKQGARLVVRPGDPRRILPDLVRRSGAGAVFVNRDYSPYGRRRDHAVKVALREKGVAWREHADLVLVEPWGCVKDDETPYTVFTPYARRWRVIEKCPPVRRPRLAQGSASPIRRIAEGRIPTLSDLGLTLSAGILSGGEDRAAHRLRRLVRRRLGRYRSDRDSPAIEGTSCLSADLKHGTVSPRQVYAAVSGFLGPDLVDLDPARPAKVLTRADQSRLREAGTFVTELCWRDFYQSVLFHFPHVLRGAFRARFDEIVWPETRPEIIEAWTEGRTGFPFIDAGMRQLARTGWMHNRLRMVTASFLTKILLVDWRVGEKVFMQRLVDGDVASNNGGWQWSASTGTDATPYFRIFNPVLQSRKFDARGDFIRRWVPELADVEAPLIHEPSRDPFTMRRTGYPPPCVDYAERRIEALALLGSN